MPMRITCGLNIALLTATLPDQIEMSEIADDRSNDWILDRRGKIRMLSV
jgi:hypothetical protein